MQISKRTDIQKFDGTQDVRIAIRHIANAMQGKRFDRLVYRDDLEFANDKDNPDVVSLRAGLVPVVNGKEVPLLAISTFAISKPVVDHWLHADGECASQRDAEDAFHKEAWDIVMDNLGSEGFNIKALCDAMVEKFKDGGTFHSTTYNYRYHDDKADKYVLGVGAYIGFDH